MSTTGSEYPKLAKFKVIYEDKCIKVIFKCGKENLLTSFDIMRKTAFLKIIGVVYKLRFAHNRSLKS